MDYGIFDVLKLIGSLGVFLYGMKLMSESLQKLAGNKMRQILTAMTSNRVTGVLTGLFITALIQSSSATTVMVVSFVNAGLLDLVGSIGVILGANVGTTITSWLVAVLGLGKFSMSDLALPIIGCSLPLLFSQKRSRKTWGEMFVGFGLLLFSPAFSAGIDADRFAHSSRSRRIHTKNQLSGIPFLDDLPAYRCRV